MTSYAEYLRIQREQLARDRARFLGQDDPAPNEPRYDARDGSRWYRDEDAIDVYEYGYPVVDDVLGLVYYSND